MVLVAFLIILQIAVMYFIIKYAVKSAIREIKEEEKNMKDINI